MHGLSLGGGAVVVDGTWVVGTTSRRLGLLAYIVDLIAPAFSCCIRFAVHVLVFSLDGDQQYL